MPVQGCPAVRLIALFLYISQIRPLNFRSEMRRQVAFSIKCYFLNKHKFIDLAPFQGRRPVLSLQPVKIGVKLVPAYEL